MVLRFTPFTLVWIQSACAYSSITNLETRTSRFEARDYPRKMQLANVPFKIENAKAVGT